jgi:RNA polymerase sigma-70 factor, ECF subfamily
MKCSADADSNHICVERALWMLGALACKNRSSRDLLSSLLARPPLFKYVTARSSSLAAPAPSASPASLPRIVAPRTLALASDEELGRALLAGHPEAPRVTWQRFLPLVKRMLRRALCSTSEVEDVSQTVFLCLFRRVHTLRDPVALPAFVVGITLRVVHEEVRRKHKLTWGTRHAGYLQSETPGVSADAIPKHAFNNLYQLVRRLKAREQEAFVLRFVEGMDASEIADALGVSEPTARRSFSRAHKLISQWARRDPFLVDYVR